MTAPRVDWADMRVDATLEARFRWFISNMRVRYREILCNLGIHGNYESWSDGSHKVCGWCGKEVK